jgi:hypothetical protein
MASLVGRVLGYFGGAGGSSGTLKGPLNSSCLSFYEYDTRTQLLILSFRDGRGPYHYYNVPQPLVRALATSGSPGGVFNAAIRGVYE